MQRSRPYQVIELPRHPILDPGRPQIVQRFSQHEGPYSNQGALDETSCTMDLTKPEVITNLEDTIAEQIQEEIYASWKRMKDLNVDVVGFWTRFTEDIRQQANAFQSWSSRFRSWNSI